MVPGDLAQGSRRSEPLSFAIISSLSFISNVFRFNPSFPVPEYNENGPHQERNSMWGVGNDAINRDHIHKSEDK